MKSKFIILFILVLFQCSLMGQMTSLKSKEIKVNWNKTTHLIFPSSIKYYNSVSDFVICQKTVLDNILSIKANQENWKDYSNLSVATSDGNFYNFNVSYADTLLYTSYDIKENKILGAQRVGVNQKNDLHLLFDKPVLYIDYGSDVIEALPAENLQNIVRVSVKDKFDIPTNVSVATSKNELHSFNIYYDEDASEYSFFIGEQEEDKNIVLLNKEDLTDDIRKTITESIVNRGRNIYNLGLRRNKIEFSINNIFVREDKLIFRLALKNKSNIKYDIDYLKFYIVDKKVNRKTASQEIEYTPLFIDNYIPIIEGKGENIFAVCFDKFTIPDNKYFIIEINEKNGGRHIVFKVNNKDIINAEAL